MTMPNALCEALLELGLEDLIPLPEALADPEVLDAAGGASSVDQVASALLELLRDGRISVWTGHWRMDPRRVAGPEAEQLLNDHARYTFEGEGESASRVYFANVENIP